MRENGNGAGDAGDDDFFRELRKRKVGPKKAREIVNTNCDPARVLALIDTRPNPSDPNSLGLLIIDILDGVAFDAAPPRPHALPQATRANLPDSAVSPAQLLQKARERNAAS